MFLIVPAIINVPMGLCALYFIDIIGLKKSIWICTTLSTIGNLIRLGTLFHDGSNYEDCEQNRTGIISDTGECPQFHLGYDFSSSLISNTMVS